MKKLAERLLIFFIGVPVFFALIFLLPHYRHLSFNVLVIIFSAIGAMEFSAMLEKKQMNISKTEALILGSAAPLAAVLTVCFYLPEWLIPLFIMAGVSWVILSRFITSSEKMENVANNIAGCFSVIVYPGFFLYWLIKMSVWENSSGVIFLFLLIVFFNDGAAWFFGNLFGKNNRGVIPASPNKSIAGFAGGLFASVVIATGAAWFFPNIFNSASFSSSLLAPVIILGLFTGIFGTLGDLAESAIKRSCDTKNSGTIMLERGGILDSVDSVCTASPVFFMIYNIFFHVA